MVARKNIWFYTPHILLSPLANLARIFHESLAATTDMAVLPGVLGCSFGRLRTSSPCDVPFRYASGPTPCGCPVARPSSRSRDSNSWNIRARLKVLFWQIRFLWDIRNVSLLRRDNRFSCITLQMRWYPEMYNYLLAILIFSKEVERWKSCFVWESYYL